MSKGGAKRRRLTTSFGNTNTYKSDNITAKNKNKNKNNDSILTSSSTVFCCLQDNNSNNNSDRNICTDLQKNLFSRRNQIDDDNNIINDEDNHKKSEVDKNSADYFGIKNKINYTYEEKENCVVKDDEYDILLTSTFSKLLDTNKLTSGLKLSTNDDDNLENESIRKREAVENYSWNIDKLILGKPIGKGKFGNVI